MYYAKTVLTIPAHHWLRDTEVELIADAVLDARPSANTVALHPSLSVGSRDREMIGG